MKGIHGIMVYKLVEATKNKHSYRTLYGRSVRSEKLKHQQSDYL